MNIMGQEEEGPNEMQTPARIFRPWDNSFHSSITVQQNQNAPDPINSTKSNNKRKQQQQEQQQTTSNCSLEESHASRRDIRRSDATVSHASLPVSLQLALPLSNVASPSTSPLEIPPYIYTAPLDVSFTPNTSVTGNNATTTATSPTAASSAGQMPMPFMPVLPSYMAAFNDFYQHHSNAKLLPSSGVLTPSNPVPHLMNTTTPSPPHPPQSTTSISSSASQIALDAFAFIEEEYVRVITEEAHIKATNARKQRPKKFRCQHCNVAFANNGQLKGHLRIHTGERPFKCDTCSKTFTRNEELTRHKRIHTGLRPYPCTICGKKFGRRDHLKKHMKTHLPQDPHRHQLPSSLFMSMYPYMYGYV